MSENSSTNGTEVNNLGSFIWSIANLLRGTYKRSDYGKVVLPFTVLRRFDAVLESSKAEVLSKAESLKDSPTAEHILPVTSGYAFYNTSRYTLATIANDPSNVRANLIDYVNGFSANVRDIFDRYEFSAQLARLDENDLLYLVLQRFAGVDLHPDKVSNTQMGSVFEELIRKFAEESNETAGEHFTPREVVRLMVSLLFTEHPDENPDKSMTKPGSVRTVYDPTAGTGGMLSVSDEYVREHFPQATLRLLGQELNQESFAIAKADMVIKGQSIDDIIWGDTLTSDGHVGKTFDYGISNPPFGVEWKKQQKFVTDEHKLHGFDGRFGPGLPRVSDGSLLFLMHLVKKMRPSRDGGGRVGIVLNGSPLFTGGAGSGESEIRKYLFENDLVDAIIGMPTDLFYNTGIATYIWILDNDKPASRKNRVQLIDATDQWVKMRKSLGSKRREISPQQVQHIVRLYGQNEEAEGSKIFKPTDFGYTTITVERPQQFNWALTSDRLAVALAQKSMEKYKVDWNSLKVSAETDPIAPTTNEKMFADQVKQRAAFDSPPAALFKTLISGLAERDESAPTVTDTKGRPVADTSLRDTENIPLDQEIDEYVAREIAPHVEHFWLDRTKDKVGYEVPFTRHFYKYVSPRPLEEIDAELNTLIGEITTLLAEVEK